MFTLYAQKGHGQKWYPISVADNLDQVCKVRDNIQFIYRGKLVVPNMFIIERIAVSMDYYLDGFYLCPECHERAEGADTPIPCSEREHYLDKTEWNVVG